jgi:uncharacterized protein DUF3558
MSPNLEGHRVSPVAIVLAMLFALVGCSSSTPSSSKSSSPRPSPSPSDLAQALSRYAMSSCALLDDQELAAYGITQPPREIDLSEGPALSCYWLVSTGIQLGWIPYPREEARKSKANEPGAEVIEVAGYSTMQTADKESCYQNIRISSDDSYNSFSILVVRHESDAPKDPCGIATSFGKLVISKLRQYDGTA